MTIDNHVDLRLPENKAAIRAAWLRTFALIVFPTLAVFAYCALDPNLFNDGDTNWHVTAGRWILTHKFVPNTDPFSFTAAGHHWVAQEWLSEVFMWLAYSWGGWSGVMLLAAAAAAVAFALLAAELCRHLGTLSVIACLGLSLTLVVPHLLARPHILALPLLVFWTVQLLVARRENRAPSLYLLPMMALWANLHGSFIIGLGFGAIFALEAFLAAKGRRLEVAARWGAFLIAATLMALITPNGVAGLTFPIYLTSLKGIQSIKEWAPAAFDKPSVLEFVLFFTLFICLYRGVRMTAVRLGLLLLLLYMTFQHVRQEFILAFIAPLLMAEPLGRALEPARPADEQAPAWPPLREIAAPVAAAVLLFAGLGVWRVVTPEVRVDSYTVPVTALEHVPASLRVTPVFNDYSFGGWLVFKGVRPFIDGRLDMYGDALLQLYLDAESGDQGAIDKAFRRFDIQWTILTPKSPLVARLDKTAGWRRLYADKWAVVQVRGDALPADAPALPRAPAAPTDGWPPGGARASP